MTEYEICNKVIIKPKWLRDEGFFAIMKNVSWCATQNDMDIIFMLLREHLELSNDVGKEALKIHIASTIGDVYRHLSHLQYMSMIINAGDIKRENWIKVIDDVRY